MSRKEWALILLLASLIAIAAVGLATERPRRSFEFPHQGLVAAMETAQAADR
jgi:hypothetical protein